MTLIAISLFLSSTWPTVGVWEAEFWAAGIYYTVGVIGGVQQDMPQLLQLPHITFHSRKTVSFADANK